MSHDMAFRVDVSGSTVTDITRVEAVLNVGDRTDTFNYTIYEYESGQRSKAFSQLIGNRVNIYATQIAPINTANDIIFAGQVSEISYDVSTRANVFKFSGEGRIEKLLSKLELLRSENVPAAFRVGGVISGNVTAELAIRWLISRANDGLKAADKITWHAGNATTTQAIEVGINYRAIFDHIVELSKDQFTGNGDKIFWLDTDNAFHWIASPTTAASTLTHGTQIESMEIQRSSNTSVNMLIINAGRDLNDNSIHTFVFNAVSIAEIGVRPELKLAESIANQLKPSFSGSNAAFRTEAKARARERFQPIVDRLAAARWEAKIELRGTKTHTQGTKLTIVSATVGAPFDAGVKMLINEVRHIIDQNGWKTQLGLLEAVEDASFVQLEDDATATA